MTRAAVSLFRKPQGLSHLAAFFVCKAKKEEIQTLYLVEGAEELLSQIDHLIGEFGKNQVKLSRKGHNASAKAAFEVIDAVVFAGGIFNKGDSLEVVGAASALNRPLDHSPLHEIVGLNVPVFIS